MAKYVGKPSDLLPEALAKNRMMIERLEMIEKKTLASNEYVWYTNETKKKMYPKAIAIRPVESLLGSRGIHVTMGFLARTPTGDLILCGHKNFIRLDISQAVIETEIYDGQVVLVEGGSVTISMTASTLFGTAAPGAPSLSNSSVNKDSNVSFTGFPVRCIMSPPIVSREVTSVDTPPFIFGGQLTNLQKNVLEEIHPEEEEAMIAVLSDVHLDRTETLARIECLLTGFLAAGSPPHSIVLMGPFHSQGAAAPLPDYAKAFSNLGAILKTIHGASNIPIFIMASTHDPGVAHALPIPPLPSTLTAHIADFAFSKLKNVHIVSNPFRMRYYGKEVVFFRYDVGHSLSNFAQALITPGLSPEEEDLILPSLEDVDFDAQLETAALEKRRRALARTLLSQSHLIPMVVGEASLNVRWEHDYALRMPNLPHAIIMSDRSSPIGLHEDAAAGWHVSESGVEIVNVGAFSTSFNSSVEAEGGGFSFMVVTVMKDGVDVTDSKVPKPEILLNIAQNGIDEQINNENTENAGVDYTAGILNTKRLYDENLAEDTE